MRGGHARRRLAAAAGESGGGWGASTAAICVCVVNPAGSKLEEASSQLGLFSGGWFFHAEFAGLPSAQVCESLKLPFVAAGEETGAWMAVGESFEAPPGLLTASQAAESCAAWRTATGLELRGRPDAAQILLQSVLANAVMNGENWAACTDADKEALRSLLCTAVEVIIEEFQEAGEVRSFQCVSLEAAVELLAPLTAGASNWGKLLVDAQSQAGQLSQSTEMISEAAPAVWQSATVLRADRLRALLSLAEEKGAKAALRDWFKNK